MLQEQKNEHKFLESFIYNSEIQDYQCPKCNASNYRIWPGMFVDKFICNNCGYTAHM